MYIYIGLVLYVIIVGLLMFVNKPDSLKKRRHFLWLSIIPMIMIMGFRDIHIGTDTTAYSSYFKQVSHISWWECLLGRGTAIKNAPCYLLWEKFVAIISGENYQWLLVGNAIIINVCIAYFIYKESNHVVLSTILYIMGYYYCASFNISRQFMALGYMLVAYVYIKEKKIKRAGAFAILGIGTHITSICFLPILILASDKISKKNVSKICIVFTVCLSAVWIFRNQLVEMFIKLFPKYKGYIASSGINMQTMGEGKKIYLSIFYLFFIIILIYILLRGSVTDEKKKAYLLDLIIPSSVGIVMGLLGAKLILVSRMEQFFSIFVICLIPEVIWSIDKRYRYLMTIMVIGIMFVPFYIQLNAGISGVVPYKWFW